MVTENPPTFLVKEICERGIPRSSFNCGRVSNLKPTQIPLPIYMINNNSGSQTDQISTVLSEGISPHPIGNTLQTIAYMSLS